MIGIYNNQKYFASMHKEDISLITRNNQKALEGFERKRDYYLKKVELNDNELESVYDLHFYVKYTDGVETKTIWCIDDGRSVGIKQDVENNLVVIDVEHGARDNSWIRYDKGAASKIISLDDCEEFFIEKVYVKKNKVLTEVIEKFTVTREELIKTMVETRRDNL